MQKTLTFGIPCYNSSEYMDHCISSILEGSDYADDVQIVVVDDGSTKDDTYEKAQEWEKRYPNIVKAVHQENGGHGMAVLKGLENADGTYFKVVDSDDWVDGDALKDLLATLRRFISFDTRVDLVISNYVYEHVEDGKQNVVDYGFALPKGKIMTWDKIGHFNMSQNLLMHALCYRTDVLRDGGVPMPAHTFYVDNIYAYVPLPRCKTLYYLDVDLYRYFIGREDQSVNESVMVGRIDQQLRITRIMMHAYHLYDDVESPRLRSYMIGYFTLMMAVCSIFSKLSDKPDAIDNLNELWEELRQFDSRMYRRARKGIVGLATNLPGAAGTQVTLFFYRAAQKLVKFN
ncbi:MULTISPECIES: glycosyltransferase family 2 protein [Atopobiaceae]|uniref:Glycosyltransferase involved in cell wall bisynthesis n=1 Tax=Parafannyhessea umbonata TaxID=604330 RepID=A0A1H6JIC4_9ACTN|nr:MULTISPECIES: glycosyltransferase family A protein [Atopobiaceae]SEH58703.1 Glycosyltransferase involved in cell wall bisynthesis [Parafannyhessea umbonata]SJZ52237.1 Glycosyltransferase involved in cell wall bisynthesis [Olsenella sp. KH1P3]